MEEPDGTFSVLAELDGRYLPTEVAGGFTGRVIGMYAADGTMRFDWLDYEPLGSRIALPELTSLDVDSDPQLQRRYGLKIPVLLLDSVPVCSQRLDAAELQRLLRRP